MQRTLPLLMCLVSGLVLLGCEKESIQTELLPERITEATGAFVIARVDAVVLEAPDFKKAKPSGTVRQGDQLIVLSQRSVSQVVAGQVGQVEWSKVTILPTNTTGWIPTNLCLTIPKSPYWEGDTQKARKTARKIYQDKFMVERSAGGKIRFPVQKVTVEESFKQVIFSADSGGAEKEIMTRKDAEALASYWIDEIVFIYAKWKRPVIKVKGFDGKTDYEMTMGSNKKAIFVGEELEAESPEQSQ